MDKKADNKVDKKIDKKIDKVEDKLRQQRKVAYDFKILMAVEPTLKPFVVINPYGNESIDFANPAAVKALNKALLKHQYKIEHWDIPNGYLCPPIPGRAAYIRRVAEILQIPIASVAVEYAEYRDSANSTKATPKLFRPIPKGKSVKILDIGTGANMIYPIIGHQEYGWQFVATDIDEVALASAEQIIDSNPALKGNVICRFQSNPNHFFGNVIDKGDYFHITMCNPPFHTSLEEAAKGTRRKLNNLNKSKAKNTKATTNFGGQSNELWCEGGELAFITKMVNESVHFKKQCLWFSTMISKQDNTGKIIRHLKKLRPVDLKVMDMEIGNKMSRALFWRW